MVGVNRALALEGRHPGRDRADPAPSHLRPSLPRSPLRSSPAAGRMLLCVRLLIEMSGGLVVVLGAGASRGVAIPKGARPECLPPLNADFFTQLQRITLPSSGALGRLLVPDLLRIDVYTVGNDDQVKMLSD